MKFPVHAPQIFSAQPQHDAPLSLGYQERIGKVTVHAHGCKDLAKADQVAREGVFDVAEALNYLDDWYWVANCAKARNWSKADKEAAEAAMRERLSA